MDYNCHIERMMMVLHSAGHERAKEHVLRASAAVRSWLSGREKAQRSLEHHRAIQGKLLPRLIYSFTMTILVNRFKDTLLDQRCVQTIVQT